MKKFIIQLKKFNLNFIFYIIIKFFTFYYLYLQNILMKFLNEINLIEISKPKLFLIIDFRNH